MKISILLFYSALVLTSCYSYRNISVGKELTAEDIRKKMQPSKIHRITFKSGDILKVTILAVDSTTVYGKILKRNGKVDNAMLQDTPENLSKNAVAIERRKFNIYKTTVLVAVAHTTYVLILQDMMNDGF